MQLHQKERKYLPVKILATDNPQATKKKGLHYSPYISYLEREFQPEKLSKRGTRFKLIRKAKYISPLRHYLDEKTLVSFLRRMNPGNLTHLELELRERYSCLEDYFEFAKNLRRLKALTSLNFKFVLPRYLFYIDPNVISAYRSEGGFLFPMKESLKQMRKISHFAADLPVAQGLGQVLEVIHGLYNVLNPATLKSVHLGIREINEDLSLFYPKLMMSLEKYKLLESLSMNFQGDIISPEALIEGSNSLSNLKNLKKLHIIASEDFSREGQGALYKAYGGLHGLKQLILNLEDVSMKNLRNLSESMLQISSLEKIDLGLGQYRSDDEDDSDFVPEEGDEGEDSEESEEYDTEEYKKEFQDYTEEELEENVTQEEENNMVEEYKNQEEGVLQVEEDKEMEDEFEEDDNLMEKEVIDGYRALTRAFDKHSKSLKELKLTIFAPWALLEKNARIRIRDVSYFTDCFVKFTNLQYLTLHAIDRVEEGALENLFNSLQGLGSLGSLSISIEFGFEMNDKMFEYLGNSIANNTNLKDLHLYFRILPEVSDVGLESIVKGFSVSNSLQKCAFYVNGCPKITKEVVNSVVKVLERLKDLESANIGFRAHYQGWYKPGLINLGEKVRVVLDSDIE